MLLLRCRSDDLEWPVTNHPPLRRFHAPQMSENGKMLYNVYIIFRRNPRLRQAFTRPCYESCYEKPMASAKRSSVPHEGIRSLGGFLHEQWRDAVVLPSAREHGSTDVEIRTVFSFAFSVRFFCGFVILSSLVRIGMLTCALWLLINIRRICHQIRLSYRTQCSLTERS